MEEEVFLFKPTSQDMKIEYPELRDVKEFMELKTAEFKFVWYYGNRTSPYFEFATGDRNKIIACMTEAFGRNFDKNSEDNRRYLSGNFPPKIKGAIERMSRYSPSARLRAKMAAEKVFNILEKSLVVDESMQKLIDEDLEVKKKFLDLSVKVTESMPDVVSQIEEGFGIRAYQKKGGKERKPPLMDELHMEDQD